MVSQLPPGQRCYWTEPYGSALLNRFAFRPCFESPAHLFSPAWTSTPSWKRPFSSGLEGETNHRFKRLSSLGIECPISAEMGSYDLSGVRRQTPPFLAPIGILDKFVRIGSKPLADTQKRVQIRNLALLDARQSGCADSTDLVGGSSQTESTALSSNEGRQFLDVNFGWQLPSFVS